MLAEKIEKRTAKVVVVGGGYVGLPLAVAIAQAGFDTRVFDIDQRRVDAVNYGRSYIDDVSNETLAGLVASNRFLATYNPRVFSDVDVVIICVPTPLNKTKDPDNSHILAAAEMIAPHTFDTRDRPRLVVLESTTFPGFTREALLPKLLGKLDTDFFLAFSPERVDPGNKTFGVKNTSRVVGGVSPKSTELAAQFYRTFVEHVLPVSTADAAEMTKLLENTYRAVNIGLVNEIAIMCGHLGLDTREVLDAAATKPFGFQRFTPGPGIGGHCIPIDPLYLSWKLKTLKYKARFVELADEINSSMPDHVVTMIATALNKAGKPVNGSAILVCGVAYKKDVSDTRESPALDIIARLREFGANVFYQDSRVEQLVVGSAVLPYDAWRDSFDLAVVVTDHSDVDYALLAQTVPIVVDTRGVVPPGSNVVRL